MQKYSPCMTIFPAMMLNVWPHPHVDEPLRNKNNRNVFVGISIGGESMVQKLNNTRFYHTLCSHENLHASLCRDAHAY